MFIKNTDSFFEENCLIVLFVRRGGSNLSYTIDKITHEYGRMYINMNNKRATFSLDNTTYFHTFISIPKEKVENITDVVVCIG